MNCHEDNKGKGGNHKHSPLKHMLHMILCCGLPIVVIGLLPFIARISPSAAGVLARIAPFICPLMMIAMIPMMLGGNKKGSCCDNKSEN
ncbi:hypothetical protein GOM49_13585 [Clostridium bovifaecis]|uniref:DUF2933 domain-containing protein n=1 Tax=Clostridium bovifaecis TaxID=2184719 RepID=A0A6I6EQH5_9CLOT|nr:hypothetical protein GOM49_13585 [Clostridium bovifaecis]